MTSHQMVCHLSDSFRVVLGEKPWESQADFKNNLFIKWIALYVPVPWPKEIPTRREVEQGLGGTPPLDFQSDRETLVELIECFCDPQRPAVSGPHPLFGSMGPRQWLRWAYLHTDHHLRQFGV